MSALGLFNFCIAQWFGVRLARVVSRGETVGWRWLRWIWPLTGWWSDYRFIGRRC